MFIISSVPSKTVVPIPSTILLFTPELSTKVPLFVILFDVVIILLADVVKLPPLSFIFNASCWIKASFITEPTIVVEPVPLISLLLVPLPLNSNAPLFVMPLFITKSDAFAIKLPVIVKSF